MVPVELQDYYIYYFEGNLIKRGKKDKEKSKDSPAHMKTQDYQIFYSVSC